jgi:hypothetical protein
VIWIEKIYREAPQKAKFLVLPIREEGLAIWTFYFPDAIRGEYILDSAVVHPLS